MLHEIVLALEKCRTNHIQCNIKNSLHIYIPTVMLSGHCYLASERECLSKKYCPFNIN